MIVTVNDDCIACGLCINMCPEVFDYNAEGMSCVTGDPNSCADLVQEAAAACPVNAIEVE